MGLGKKVKATEIKPQVKLKKELRQSIKGKRNGLISRELINQFKM